MVLVLGASNVMGVEWYKSYCNELWRCDNHYDDIIAFVQKLIDSGHAYASEFGDVYFKLDSFSEYGIIADEEGYNFSDNEPYEYPVWGADGDI